MRSVYLITYDVCDAVRLRKVYKVMRRYGDHTQFSVFRCTLNDVELVRMKSDLTSVINTHEDQVLIVDMGPADGRGERAIVALGRAYTHPERCVIVV